MEPQVLIITDNDRKYGIDNGYYPQMTEALNYGQFKIISIDEFKQNQFMTSTPPLFNGRDFYLRNPYNGNYISMDDKDILIKLIKSKNTKVKETLIRMGAKSVSLYEETSDIDKTNVKFSGNANIKLAHANIDANYDNKISVNIKSELAFTEDPECPNQPRNYESVKKYIFDHGLGGEDDLVAWLERLKEDGKLIGTEKISVTYFSELQNALRITSSIDYKLFNAELDFSLEHNHVHTITKTLSVNFG
ncbi:MAG: hypothetical protein MJZ08_07085 [Bacteroidaceae bacterium]|nr:hypothetical protein [Bacteroidaceae bacterium]